MEPDTSALEGCIHPESILLLGFFGFVSAVFPGILAGKFFQSQFDELTHPSGKRLMKTPEGSRRVYGSILGTNV